MKFFLLTKDVQSYIGFRLAGIDGEVIENSAVLLKRLNKVCSDTSIGVVLVTDDLVREYKELFLKIKAQKNKPIIEIPASNSEYSVKESIESYINNVIGVES
ncbi:MAG: V-type ATP synthase subunit F [Oscillospiraceae bacterium]|nr:V-type ATP synthase subunit F [Oscillospiraceae bacterium]